MIIEYRRITPQTSRTGFARMRPQDQKQLEALLLKWITDCSEASVQGTDRDRELWAVATQPDHQLWHRAQQHRNQPNTMISVMAGALGKLSAGLDLTDKQLEHCQRIAQVMHHYRPHESLVEFRPADNHSQERTGLERLRESLFHDE